MTDPTEPVARALHSYARDTAAVHGEVLEPWEELTQAGRDYYYGAARVAVHVDVGKRPASAHYVRHILRSGDYVLTEYRCCAAEDAPCRTVCTLCVSEERECCQCDYVEVDGKEGRTPQIEHGQQCSIVAWLSEDAPEECYNGDRAPVRGPDWQPITPEWNGDNYDWDYAV